MALATPPCSVNHRRVLGYRGMPGVPSSAGSYSHRRCDRLGDLGKSITSSGQPIPSHGRGWSQETSPPCPTCSRC